MSHAAEPVQKLTSEEGSEHLARVAARFGEAPQSLLAWAVEIFAPEICLATSFGPQSIALMHMISSIRPQTTVFYLDTDLLFPETYELRDRLSARLGLSITRVPASLSLAEQEASFGPELWSREPDRCCQLRKVLPLSRFLAGKRAWITGIRAGQTAARARARVVEWDQVNGLVKLNPLLHWSSEQVWAYIRAHDLPSSPLHLVGYPSVGCRPCTRPVRADEDPRAGRWPGFQKTECGIHQAANNGHPRAAAPRPLALRVEPVDGSR